MLKKINYIIKKYEVNIISASTSFYFIVAIFSLLSLLFQFYNTFFIDDNFIISKIFEIINPYYHDLLKNIFPIFSLNDFSPVLFVNLVWSASKLINGYNKACEKIYSINNNKNFVISRISSFFIFLLISGIILFEIVTILFAKELMKILFLNKYIYVFLQFIIELILIFSFVTSIYWFIIPRNLEFKNIYFPSLVVTLIIYILCTLFIIFIQLFQSININYSFLSIIGFAFLWIYMINFIIVIGFYFIYFINKYHHI